MALFSWASSWSTRVSGEDLVEWEEAELMIHATFLLENTGLDDFFSHCCGFAGQSCKLFYHPESEVEAACCCKAQVKSCPDCNRREEEPLPRPLLLIFLPSFLLFSSLADSRDPGCYCCGQDPTSASPVVAVSLSGEP